MKTIACTFLHKKKKTKEPMSELTFCLTDENTRIKHLGNACGHVRFSSNKLTIQRFLKNISFQQKLC